VLRDVSNLDTSTTILGQSLSMPLILSPTGYTRIADSQGELAVARAAARAGIPYTLSTMGTCSIEEVAAEQVLLAQTRLLALGAGLHLGLVARLAELLDDDLARRDLREGDRQWVVGADLHERDSAFLELAGTLGCGHHQRVSAAYAVRKVFDGEGLHLANASPALTDVLRAAGPGT